MAYSWSGSFSCLKFLGLTTVLILLLLTPVAAQLSSEQFQIAKSNLELGNYGLVLSATNSAVDSRVRMLRGQVLEAASSPEALAYFGNSVEVAPRNAEARAWFAYELAKLEHFSDSRANLDKSLQLDPRNAFAHAAKGYFLFRIHEDGSSEFSQAIKLDSGSVSVRLLLLDSTIRQLDLAKANIQLTALLQKYPRMPVWRVKEGQLFEEKGARLKAEHSYSQAIDINPHFQLAYILKAKLLSAEGRWADASAVCKQGLIADSVPELRRQAFRMKIVCDEKLGKPNEVISDAVAYLQDGNNNLDVSDATAKVWLSKALAEERLKRYSEAMISVNTLILRSRRKTEGLTIKANLYREIGDNDSALRLLNSLIAKDDFVSQWHLERAKVFRNLGHPDQAKKDIDRARELDRAL
jgi:tetratricopeptide (TPR) repeat protein